MTQATDVKEIKDKVVELDYEIKDVRRGVNSYMEKTDEHIKELRITVENNTTAISKLGDILIENNGVLKGFKLAVQVLAGIITLGGTITGIVVLF